jgi:hypothetical protein
VVGIGEAGKGVKALTVAVSTTTSKKYPWINGLMVIGEAARDPAGQEVMTFYEWKVMGEVGKSSNR